MSYLDEITELSIQAQEVISRLAVIQAERSEAGEGSPKLRDQILRFTQLLSQSLNTSLSEENRLKLLTRLVNDARLAEVPYYPYPPIEVTVAPTQRCVGDRDHNSLSNIQGDGFFHLSAAQRSLLLSALQPAGLTFGGLLGLPGDNVALAAVLAGKEPVISPSGNAAQFLNGNKVFAVVQYSQIGGKPTTLAGFGISASDTLFDNKYLQLGSPLTGISTVTGTQLDASTTVIQGFGRLQNQVNTKEPALGNPSVNGYVLSSTTAGVRSWVPAPTGAEVTAITLTGTNGITGSVVISAGTADIVAGTNITGILKGNGTAISAATEMTDYIGITGANNGDTILFTGGVATWAPGLSNPMTTLGDLIYGGASGATTRLAGNTTATNKFLRSVGDGTLAAAPTWEALVAADIPNIDITQVTGLSTALSNKLGTTLASGKIFVGNGSGAASPVLMSADATMSNTGALTIANSAVTFAKMQNASVQYALIGRWSAGSGVFQEVTIDGTTIVIDAFGVMSATGGGGGGVTGPVSSADGNFAVYNGTTGKIIKEPTGASLSSAGVASFASIQVTGTGGAGHIHFRQQSSAPTGIADYNLMYGLDSGTPGFGFIIGGDAFASVIRFGATVARQYTLPDADGTFTVLGNTTTGSGAIVLAGSPTLVTPVLGVASATSINKVAITTPATGSTLTIADGKTLTASNTLTFTGTDGSSVAFGGGGTVAYVGLANTWTSGIKQTFAPSAANAGINVGTLAGQPSSPVNGDLVYNSSATALQAYINGVWVSLGAGGGSGVTTVGAFSGSSQTNGASISSTTITFGPADGTNPGMVTTGSQTLAGPKTFSSAMTLNAAGSLTTAQLTLAGATNNWISFSAGGTAAPALTNRSVGTKVVLYASLSGVALDYAIGTGVSTMWMSLGASTDVFHLYAPISSAVTSVFSITPTTSIAFNGSAMTFGTNTTSTNVTGSGANGIVSRNFINLGTGGGTAGPAAVAGTFSARSLGTRLIVQSTGNTAQADMALGYNTNEFWFSLFTNTSATSYAWYGLTTKVMTLQGDGELILTGSLTMADAKNIILNATTGTKIGTATSQKLGFWNATPVIQPAGANQAAITDSTGGTASFTLVDVGAVFSQANINNNFASLSRQVDAFRTALVNAGIIKGAA